MKLGKKKTGNFTKSFIKAINGRHFEYAVYRNSKDYTDAVVGRDGYINIHDGEVVIMCENRELFRRRIEDTCAWELLSLNGAVFQIDDDHSLMLYYNKIAN